MACAKDKMKYQDLSDGEIVTKTLFGEARGELIEAMVGVANTIRNRVISPITWWGNSYRTVCLKKWQFPCWNENDPNLPKILNPSKQEEKIYYCCRTIAILLMKDLLKENTGGATHYFDISLKENPPKWIKEMTETAKIGRLFFYKT